MAANKDTRLYKAVSSSSTETDEYTPGTNVKVYITEVGGNACYSPDVKVEVKFGTDVLFVTHGDSIQNINQTVTGDNSKKLAILLTNDTDQTETIGGYYKATEL
jgi:hypothetical protein